MRVGEVNAQAGERGQFLVPRHLLALVIGQGEAQRCRHRQQAKPSRAVAAVASVSLISLRLVRSASVPTEERLPLIRSPSQCPGTLHLRRPFADDVADPAPPFAIPGPPTTMRLALAAEQLAPQLTARHGVDRLVDRLTRSPDDMSVPSSRRCPAICSGCSRSSFATSANSGLPALPDVPHRTAAAACAGPAA